MHAFFAPFGIYPNNAIVGGSGSVAPGAALFKRVNRKPGIVVANIGDASFGCGPVWEGITLSAMAQYRSLWDESLGGGLPIIFNCMNNFYGMGGQTLGETMGVDAIARIGAGVNPEQMHAERVNGYDPLPVIDAFRRKKQLLWKAEGPVLLDTVTYRISGHRLRMHRATARRRRSSGGSRPTRSGLSGPNCSRRRATEDALDSARVWIEAALFDMLQLVRGSGGKPARDSVGSELIGEVMFTNRRVEKYDDRAPEFLQPLEENPRVQQIRGKIRTHGRRQARPEDEGVQRPRRAFSRRCCTASRSTRR